MTARRLPAPWTFNRFPGGYVVRDAKEQELAYVHCRANEAEAMQAEVPAGGELLRVRGQHRKAAGGCCGLRSDPPHQPGSRRGPVVRRIGLTKAARGPMA
jgi:hypothetical protein